MKRYITLYLAFFIYSINSVFGKLASSYPFLSIEFIAYYGFELLGLCIYAVLWQNALSKFKLSTAYAHRASVTILSMMWGVLVFHETLTLNMLIGTFLIVLGIVIAVTENE